MGFPTASSLPSPSWSAGPSGTWRVLKLRRLTPAASALHAPACGKLSAAA